MRVRQWQLDRVDSSKNKPSRAAWLDSEFWKWRCSSDRIKTISHHKYEAGLSEVLDQHLLSPPDGDCRLKPLRGGAQTSFRHIGKCRASMQQQWPVGQIYQTDSVWRDAWGMLPPDRKFDRGKATGHQGDHWKDQPLTRASSNKRKVQLLKQTLRHSYLASKFSYGPSNIGGWPPNNNLK